MTGDHDTSDGEARSVGEPSPFAPRIGGGALISRTAPAETRYEEAQRFDRIEGLFQRLIQRYGRPRALAIMRDEDAPSNADLAKWQAFGA